MFSLAGASSKLNPKHLTNRWALKPRSTLEVEYYAPRKTADGYDGTIDEKRRAIRRAGNWAAWEVLDLWWEAVGDDGLVIWEHAQESNGSDGEQHEQAEKKGRAVYPMAGMFSIV